VTHKFSRLIKLAVCCAAISMLPLSAASLESLLGVGPGSGLVVGDVDFYDFDFDVSCTGGAGGSITDCGTLQSMGLVTGINPMSISIAPDTNGGMDGFEITTPLKATADSSGDSTTVDMTLSYDAEIVDSSNTIGDVLMQGSVGLNPVCHVGQTCPPNPSVVVSETVFNGSSPFNQIGVLQISDPPPVLSDLIDLSTDVSSLSVLKDIGLNSGTGFSGGTPDFADITALTQQLSQVPEPRAYAAVLGLFFAIFIVIKRRRQQTA
jgi:hypothetical protein